MGDTPAATLRRDGSLVCCAAEPLDPIEFMDTLEPRRCGVPCCRWESTLAVNGEEYLVFSVVLIEKKRGETTRPQR